MALTRKIAYPVVDLRLGLAFPNVASQKQVIIGPSGKVGRSDKSSGNGIGASVKSPLGRSIEGGPMARFSLYCIPQFCVQHR